MRDPYGSTAAPRSRTLGCLLATAVLLSACGPKEEAPDPDDEVPARPIIRSVQVGKSFRCGPSGDTVRRFAPLPPGAAEPKPTVARFRARTNYWTGPQDRYSRILGDPPPEGRPVPFTEVSCFGDLYVPRAGAAVIKDEATWRAFWKRFYGRPQPEWDTIPAPPPPPPPQVDFEREMVIAVGFGGGSGCGDENQIIGRMQVYQDTLHVILDPEDTGECAMVQESLHVIRLARSDLPVLFLGLGAKFLNEENLLSAKAMRER